MILRDEAPPATRYAPPPGPSTPNPASALLERLRRERADAAATPSAKPKPPAFSAAPRLMSDVSISAVAGGEGKWVASAFIAVQPALTWL
jgi:hypothetical protein